MRGGVPLARNLRRRTGGAEARLWTILRNRQLAGRKFVRQFPIGPYVVDFACREAALVIEVDGSQHQDSLHDACRTAYLNGEGYGVLRFWNNEVTGNLGAVHDAIVGVLDNHPSPGCRYAPADLSPEGRGTRGASAATTKQRSTYLDFLSRVGERRPVAEGAAHDSSPLRGEVGAQRRVRGGAQRAATTSGEET